MTVAARQINSSLYLASSSKEVAGGRMVPPSALVVSMSGLQDSTLLDAARFNAELAARGITPSLLVAPHHGKEWSLRNSPAVLDWVRRRQADGVEILLAGFDQSIRGRITEFSTLSQHEARLRLTAATRQMGALGLETDMFAPPKWAMSKETIEVLPELGFRIAADIHGVHDLVSGATDPTRVLAVGEGFGAARWWRRAVRTSVSRAIANNRPIRLSLSASKLREPKLRKDVLKIIDDALAAGAKTTGYHQVPLRVAA